MADDGATITPDPPSSTELARHLTACADEYIAEGDPIDGWKLGGEHFDPDPEVLDGPVELIRRSDGARFCASVDVAVWPKRHVPGG